MRKEPEILLILLLGLVPFLWYRPNSIIAKGDYFPFWLDSHETLSSDAYLWNADNLGNANHQGSALLHGILWMSLQYLGLDDGLIQIVINAFLFAFGGIAAYCLSKKVYPDSRHAPLVAGIFYMFNFFTLQSRLILGFIWTYAFLPFSLMLFINIMEATSQRDTGKANRNICYLALASTITLSLASINPANVAVSILVLAIVLLYYLVRLRKQVLPVVFSIMKTAVLVIPLNVWWIVPTLNFYVLAPSSLIPEVSVAAWSWTHARSSFLNLFWLNGQWGWRPEYVPYIDAFSNPVLIFLTFVPFLLAAASLLFKTRRSAFNAYIMLAVLILVFLAKGIHEPLGQLNLLLYTFIPGMNMFREPASKFTMALMPFLALLVGYSVDHLANMRVAKRFSPAKVQRVAVATFALVFVMSTFPLVVNPIETRTSQIPYSSYVHIPRYWFEAADWLNSRDDDYRILITPPDDFYMMPYAWGYFGTDDWIDRIVQKPIVSYDFGYRVNSNVTATLKHLQNTIKYDRESEFRAFLDLLSIKYILQRNDVSFNFTGRDIIPPTEMQVFLTNQPYLRLVREFGELDIYEYATAKPYANVLDYSMLERATVRIENVTKSEAAWNFTFLSEVEEWRNATKLDRWTAAYTITSDNSTLKAEYDELEESTQGWKTINSPLVPAQYGTTYQIDLDVKGRDATQVHVKTFEYGEGGSSLAAAYSKFVNDGTFSWEHISYTYDPTNSTIENLQIQIWHGHETNKPVPNIVWIDNVHIAGYTRLLNTTGLDLIFPNKTQYQPATILNYQRIDPTRITATINATEPFMLAISEALDNSWIANINGAECQPTPTYLGLAGFQINQTGLLNVTIEYVPQHWFSYGVVISSASFIITISYLVYTSTRAREKLGRLRKRLTAHSERTDIY